MVTKPLPFTQSSVRRRLQAARQAGFRVTGIAADGTVLVTDQADLAPAPPDGQDDPYVAAVGRSNAKTTGKRSGRAS